MATITAALVNELRAKTGQPMMECKKALVETGGDIEQAIAYFRNKGVKTSVTERVAGEGRVVASSTASGHVSAAVEINCNTDFTAKSDAMGKLLEASLHHLLANPASNLNNDPKIKEMVTALAQQTGENITIGRAVAMNNPSGHTGAYVYSITNKIAVLVNLSGKVDAELIKNLGGHIAFSRPVGLSRDQVPADLVAKEREIAIEQAKATGKPQQIAEKIAEGKMNSFYAERVLLDQAFFNAQVFKGSIADYLKQHGVQLIGYERIEVGA
ncbi:MAG: translation elongation factor Ts [Phycisphaerales bacterium]|nr:translation elongation factor Ts [Phycisphaerales bacterium]